MILVDFFTSQLYCAFPTNKKTTTILRLSLYGSRASRAVYQGGAVILARTTVFAVTRSWHSRSRLVGSLGASAPGCRQGGDPTSLAIAKSRDRLAYYLDGGGSSIVMAASEATRQASIAWSVVTLPGSWQTQHSRRSDHWPVQNHHKDLRLPSPSDQQPSPQSGD